MRQCQLCTNNVAHVDYKDTETLKRYIDDHSRINKSRRNGTCAKHQRKLTKAIKHARHMALLPFISS